GEVFCVRGSAREQHGVDAHSRRLWLLQGIRHRAALSRRAADLHRRGHQRNAAHHHFPAMDQAEPGRMKPLAGMRVLTVEQFGAGPYGSMFLADLGAEVIKIENAATGGDAARHVGPYLLAPGESEYFQTWNMSKRSVTLDIKSPRDRAAFDRL